MARKHEDAEPQQLPTGVASVAEIAGPISVVVVRSTCENRLAVYLSSQGFDFYSPRQRVVKYYSGRRKSWTHAMFPGILFVGNGYDGRVACANYGSMYRDQFRGFIGMIGEAENAVTKQLRRELVQTETLLGIDPELESVTGLKRGRRVRVDAGPFIDHEGIIDGDGGDGRVYVTLPILGQTIPVPVSRDMLTILD